MGFDHTFEQVPAAELQSFVRHHGIAGLLDSARVEALGEAWTASLMQEKRRIAFRALQLGAVLKLVVTALADRGLRPVALKGPALAIQAHGSLSARGGVDVDILIPEQHWPIALDVLEQQGYLPAPGQHLPLPRGTHELVLQRQNQPRVELHQRLLRHQHLLPDATDLSQAVDIQGTSVASLAPIQALPYLVAHANQHCFRRLIWLIDIHALLQNPELDAERTAREFQRTGTCAMLDVCLTLLDELFGTTAAEPLQRVRRPCRASRAMASLALEAIRGSLSDDEVAKRVGPLRRAAMDIALQDSWHARLHALGGWLSPTGKDSQWVTLPRSLSFLYPLIRLVRVLIRPAR
ncbi:MULTISPECIES: nucleotidyltransferase family protein [unclassified Pseudomonas]|uniref:nucleotidyltransferase family protein n=1 Tax=unclassified Pseudomonas TaxID=196821 RepID=UPI002449C30C|nr:MULTISPECIES: nucleotidyltransferase family protein [unclassified Pseudomonas]MDH0895932.1 nucleotidyltransferase family protein [Pseudomonas sp. GD03875]MDH1067161.1 nucleotidyltransferase family protein [Pseudomonas sp. GD03985]